MAKKAAAPTDPNARVRLALLTVANASGDVKLSGKGGVLANKTGANKEAIDRILNPDRPLLRIVRKEKKSEFVGLTPAGFLDVASDIPEEKVGGIARAIAEGLPTGDVVTFLREFLPNAPTAAPELEPLLAEAVRKQEAEVGARIKAERKQAERLEASRAAFQRCLDHIARMQSSRIEELTELLLAAGGKPPAPGMRSPSPPPVVTPPGRGGLRPEPVTTEDRDFRRDMAERLVSSWREAVGMKKEEAQRFLETALDNISGVRRIGDEGEEVRFDGALHEHIPGVFTDHPVKVTRSGWALEDGEDREYVIQKAQVAK